MGKRKNYKSRKVQQINKPDMQMIISVIIWVIIAFILVEAKDIGTGAFVRWMLVCLVLSMCIKPLFDLGGLQFCDEGFSLGFGFGLAVAFFSVWYICALTGCPFNTFTCIFGLIALTVIVVFINNKRRDYREIRRKMPFDVLIAKKRRFFTGFTVFTFLMVIAFWVKGFKPLIDFQTEQYMDFGFMNAMYRQQRLPFEDIWFAGKNVNYYYLGQATAVYMCRLSGVTPEYGYNLALCTLFTSLSMSIYMLVEGLLSSIGVFRRVGAVTGGAAAALMCSCGGNGHWIIYGIIKQLYYKATGKISEKNYWFPSSTMFIGYDPDTPDKAKHEYPSYTIVLGDLHAHVCNMFFTIPLLAVLIDYAVCSNDKEFGSISITKSHKKAAEKGTENCWIDINNLIRSICTRHTVMIGFLLGLFQGVNYWDFPIYYVVSGAVILFCDIKRYGCRITTIIKVLLKGAFILAVSAIVILPFNMTYVKPVAGIHLCDHHSSLLKLVIIWFAHIVMVVTLLVILAVRKRNSNPKVSGSVVSLSGQELAMLVLALCGIGLLVTPEFIYVKDIYGDEYQRFNTVFKLTFQGFILLSISAGCCIGLLIDRGMEAKENYLKGKGRTKGLALRILAYTYCFVVILLSAYMWWSVKSWFGNVFKKENRMGISATAFTETDGLYDNVRDSIRILNEDDDKNLHIIEEAGNSYLPESKLSVFTGATTLVGWYVHEWLWHDDSEAVWERSNEVRNFYTCGDEEYCRQIVNKYDVDYIYVGPVTLEKYEVNYNGFILLGKRVWDSSDGKCMLIKVDKEK